MTKSDGRKEVLDFVTDLQETVTESNRLFVTAISVTAADSFWLQQNKFSDRNIGHQFLIL